MQIDWNLQEKELTFWLGRDEPTPDIAFYKNNFPGYDFTIMRSGSGDVEHLTCELLRVNANPSLYDAGHSKSRQPMSENQDASSDTDYNMGLTGMDY